MKDGKERLVRRAMLASLLLSLKVPRARAQDFLVATPRVRPPPRLETVPPSPGRSYEWAPGHWTWSGTKFNWIRGRYIQRRPWSYRTVKGHIEGQGGFEKWVPGFFGGPNARSKPR